MWHVIALGLVQGLSEFLPVSSSGHLVVLRGWFGLQMPGASFEVALHGGTLCAVFIGYRKELGIWLGQWVNRDPEAVKQFWLIVVASLPAAAVGLCLGWWIERLFVPSAVSLGWLVTSVLLWLTPPGRKGHKATQHLSWTDALQIGLFQALALWPGLSRSGATIFMGRVIGLAPDEAARFSFFLSVPVVSGALALSSVQGLKWGNLNFSLVVLGMAIAALSGAFAIQWVRKALAQAQSWGRFGLYTAAMAVVAWVVGG